MPDGEKKRELTEIERSDPSFCATMRLQEIEGNPFTEDDIAMFDMFYREGWSQERCLDYLRELARREKKPFRVK